MSGRTMRRYVLNSKTGLLDPIFATGETIPESGIYRVIHSEHRLPLQVTLHKGEVFPWATMPAIRASSFRPRSK